MKLPPGWKVEVFGLANTVEFTSPYNALLVWCDGEWRMGSKHGTMPAPGVPRAATLAEARKVGTGWLNKVEAEQ